MPKPFNKIGLVILIIFFLPLVVFFIYQTASLNQSEKEINKIYFQQLETIIYSINQYSEDIVNSWTNDINIILAEKDESYSERLNQFIEENSAIKSIVISDSSFINSSIFINRSFDQQIISDLDLINYMKGKSDLSRRLSEYLEVGYQKIEVLGGISKNLNLCLFAVNKSIEKFDFSIIIFDPNEFVTQSLASKISQACGDEFVVGVINIEDNTVVHSCDRLIPEEVTISKSLWLVPDFSVGIKMKSGNIEDLINQRYTENLVILSALIVILAFGLFIVYYNLRKELKLTQLKSDFISNVSHELRTPLSLISMYSETLMLERLKSEEKKKEYYTVINNETNRLSKIVNSILNFSKMESGKRQYQFVDFNLKDLTNEILVTYDYHIRSKGFEYRVEAPDKIENIKGDSDAISESIINLIENAMKYSNDKQEFKIVIGKNSKGQYWEIHDFGIGISKEDQSKIFDKFYRVSSGLVHNTKGTGLGLSLVKQIMNVHDGEITVESTLGKGSLFRLQFSNDFNKNLSA